MKLIDMSNLSFMTILDYSNKVKEPLTDGLMRHLILKQLLYVKDKLGPKDELILSFDSRKYWRKDEFALYKGNRKENREKSGFDWDTFFAMYDVFKQELREYFPYICIEVPRAEADDVISTIVHYLKGKNCRIGSSDEDFLQLQEDYPTEFASMPMVSQYSMKLKKFITPESHNYTLFEHIVRGDSADGIPNILSDVDTFMVDGKRQKSLRATMIESWNEYRVGNYVKFPDKQLQERYELNKKLIDMKCVPKELSDIIIHEFENYQKPQGRIMEFIKKYQLTQLMTQGNF